jgi:AraC-like DNA-binding protein
LAYREYSPAEDLGQVIACTWERTAPPDQAAARILPDGCVDLIWRDGDLMVAGPDRGHFLSPLRPGARVAGVRLRPGMAGLVLGLPASELRDSRVGLEEVWGRDGAELDERLGLAAAPRKRRSILEDTVRSRLSRAGDPDPLIVAAARALGRPGARVGELGFRLGLSERQLRRRFADAVGYGPKTLDRVLRFQRFLALGTRITATEGLARLAADLGYSDQAHLSRDCLQLSGLTPTALIGERREPEAASAAG